MSIFSDIDDVRPEWWDMAACNTGTGALTGIFFPSLDEPAPVEPDFDAIPESQRRAALAAYKREIREFKKALIVMKAETEKAQSICAECPLTGPGGVCFGAAVARREAHGIWGGVVFTPRKAQRIRAKARAALEATAA